VVVLSPAGTLLGEVFPHFGTPTAVRDVGQVVVVDFV
jgi:hypothetical protein